MASFKEPTTSRPVSQHRPTSSTTPMNVPGRQNGSRAHTHSLSLGTMNSSHRITRRKSMTSNNLAAVAAAVKGMDEASLEALVSPGGKAFFPRPSSVVQRADPASTAKPGTSVPGSYGTPQYLGPDAALKRGEGAVAAGEARSGKDSSSEIRNRRASEGAYLSKSDGKRVSGELRCEKCGKGYKHSSCLTKHLWEHTPEWAYTSKLLISKHQQVQLLEAASVLVNMNQNPAGSDALKAIDSETSSASPEASGSSEIQDDDLSSVETTPPPMSEHTADSKRFSSNSSVFSRSYQSVPGTSIAASSVPSSSYGSFYGRRPSTSYSTMAFEDEASLAAATKLMSFGTPRTSATQMDEVPPVPPLPARYASHNATRSVGGTAYPSSHEVVPRAPAQPISDERDVTMGDQESKADDAYEFDDRRSVSQSRSDEHEEGFFGRMEE